MKSKKRKIAILLLCFNLLSLFSISIVNAAPAVSAQAAAVIDVKSGRILYQKQGNERMRFASLTKIMTAIVAIEEGDLNEIVTTPDYAVGTEGSSIYLRKGEKLTLENLLYGLMLRSGNDAAVTIADHIGGSLQGFVRLMNEKAEYLGLNGTHFTNPHGLDDSNNHYSTAVDLAKLTAYALHNPVFRKIVSTKVISIPQEGEDWDRKLLNKNKMLRLYEGADGVKTGYTKLAKRCLVSSASRVERQIAVVTLNAPNDWEDHARLLNYSFQNYSEVQVVEKNEKVEGEKELYTVNSFSYPLTPDEQKKIRKEVVMESSLKQLLPGRVSGYLYIYLDNQVIGKIGLISGNSEIDRATYQIFSGVFPWQNILSLFKSMIWGAI